MALRVFVVLIVLLLLMLVPQLPRWRRFGWLVRWNALLEDSSGGARLTLAVLPPVLLCALLALLFAHASLFAVLWVVFAAAVLAYTLGPRELDADIDAVLKARDSATREQAAQALRAGEDEAPLAFTAPALVEAGVLAALQRRFGVLFWFLLLGPAGALGYRLVQQLAQTAAGAGLDAAARAGARRVLEVLDWAPAHLMVFAMALVSDFDAVIHAWRGWHAAPERAARPFESGFLGAVAKAGVDADVEAGDGYAEDISDPLLELADARHLLARVLWVWLALAALLAVAGWFA